MRSSARRAAIPDELSETELVARARRRDEAAIRTLVRLNNLRLYRTARAVLADDAEAEDVVQETYLRAFTRLDTFRGGSSFSTWLTRIALNEAFGRLRRRRPGRAEASRADTEERGSIIMFPAPPSAQPEASVARRQLGALIEQAIDDLPPSFRIVFVLREIEGLSVEETAGQLGLNPATVKTRLYRAR
jgi:RNA polymerase sigma-70 factor (ECF subfamily)